MAWGMQEYIAMMKLKWPKLRDGTAQWPKNMPKRWTPPLQTLYPKLIGEQTPQTVKNDGTGGALSHSNLPASDPMTQ